MTGYTLVVSRKVNLFQYWKPQIERLGFKDIFFTEQEKDSLNSVIRKLKPALILMASVFYSRATPFMIGQLLKDFPEQNIAVINTEQFPDELGMYFILNGANSYINELDGMEEFIKGLAAVRDGKKYVSPSVIRRLEMRSEYPKPAGSLSDRELEIGKMFCCGYKEKEIEDTLHLSRRTIDNHKKEIYRVLNVRNTAELIGVGLKIGIVTEDELYFYPKDLAVKPLPGNR